MCIIKTNNLLKYSTLVLLLFITFLGACTSDSMEDEPTPDPNPNPSTCNTTNMKFSTDIMPIIQTNCYGGCHNGSSPLSGFSFETYAGVKAKVDEGRLYGAISHQAGFVAMPQNGGKLPDCEIAKIKSWIDAGAPNN